MGCFPHFHEYAPVISGGAIPGRARPNLVGRSTALAPVSLLLCFASVIVRTENENFTISDRWPLYLFHFGSETISAALVAFVFWGRRLKRSSTFLRKKVHPGDLARGCFDREMTRLLCSAGAAIADYRAHRRLNGIIVTQDTNRNSRRSMVSEKASIQRREWVSADRSRSTEGHHARRNARTIR